MRTTASASWLKQSGENFTAATAAYGMNNGDEVNRASFVLEATKRSGRYSTFGRLEYVEVETATLLGDDSIGHEEKDTVSALTVGTVRELPRWRWLETGVGAAVTFYAVPDRLQSTLRRPARLAAGVPAPAASSRRHGADVEHAHD